MHGEELEEQVMDSLLPWPQAHALSNLTMFPRHKVHLQANHRAHLKATDLKDHQDSLEPRLLLFHHQVPPQMSQLTMHELFPANPPDVQPTVEAPVVSPGRAQKV